MGCGWNGCLMGWYGNDIASRDDLPVHRFDVLGAARRPPHLVEVHDEIVALGHIHFKDAVARPHV